MPEPSTRGDTIAAPHAPAPPLSGIRPAVQPLPRPQGVTPRRGRGGRIVERSLFPVAPPPKAAPRRLDPASPVRVVAVIPCFNRPQDLALLLRDIARSDLRGIDLWCVVVDNASPDPLEARVRVPAGLRVEFVRSPRNSGGSGGFNLGMAHVMSGAGLTGRLGKPEFLWWLDSDARASRRCLREMARAMLWHSDIGAVGSALGDQVTGTLWEIGGTVFLHHGGIGVSARGDVDRRILVRSHFVAACSALVRATAVEATGLFPENFIYYDDVQWCIEMRQRTGMRVMAVPRSRAYHPPSNSRFATWTRYYMSRNCYSHIDLLGLGGRIRWKRARAEAERVVSQYIMGLDELGEIRMRGLRDAVAGDFTPREPKQILPNPLGFQPLAKLTEIIGAERARWKQETGRDATLYVHPMFRKRMVGWEGVREQLLAMGVAWPADAKRWRHRALGGHEARDLRGAFWRMLAGPDADIAIVPTGWPTAWFRGRVLIQPTSEGVLVRRVHRWKTAGLAARKCVEAFGLALRIARKAPPIQPLPPCPAWRPDAHNTIVEPRIAPTQSAATAGAGRALESVPCSPSSS